MAAGAAAATAGAAARGTGRTAEPRAGRRGRRRRGPAPTLRARPGELRPGPAPDAAGQGPGSGYPAPGPRPPARSPAARSPCCAPQCRRRTRVPSGVCGLPRVPACAPGRVGGADVRTACACAGTRVPAAGASQSAGNPAGLTHPGREGVPVSGAVARGSPAPTQSRGLLGLLRGLTAGNNRSSPELMWREVLDQHLAWVDEMTRRPPSPAKPALDFKSGSWAWLWTVPGPARGPGAQAARIQSRRHDCRSAAPGSVSGATDPSSRCSRLTEPCGGPGRSAQKTLCAEFALQISGFPR